VFNGATADLRNASFQNVSGGTLSGGSYYVGGTLLYSGGNIDTIDANTDLWLAGGQMSGTSGKDITGTLTTNNGTLTIGAPTAFTSGHFTNNGTLSVQSAGTLDLTRAPLQNVVGGVLSGGNYVLEGTLFHGAGDIDTIGAGTSVSLDGTGHMYSNLGHDITATLTTNNGELDIVGYTPVTLTAAGGLTNNGTLMVETYGGGFEIAGNVTNAGTMEVLGSNSPAVGAKIDGNFINSGGGTLWVGATPMVVDGSFTNAQGGVAAVSSCHTFPSLSECFYAGYAPGLTVHGDFTNDGTFSVDPTTYYGQVTDVQVTVDGRATNSGTLTLASGTTFTSAEFDNTGGTLLLDGSIVGPVDISGGTIDGDGLFTGNVTQSGGTLKPGDSPGTLTIDGDYSMGSGATLQIDFLNTTDGPGTGWGFLHVTGNATLGGTLNLIFLNPLTFTAGEMFEIMDYAAWLGGNLTLDAPALAGLHFTTVYGADQLDLRVDANSGSATPEPGTWALSLAALALAAAGWVRRKI
jgi:fibronectin-binding autotransporter adhesin